MTDANPSTRSNPSKPRRAQRALYALIKGAGGDEIGAAERLTRTRTVLRQARRDRSVSPAEEFAKLQIARLKQMILKLLERIRKAEPEAIDRALKIVDRLDRYREFTRARRAAEPHNEEERARLLKKVSEIADRRQAERPRE